MSPPCQLLAGACCVPCCVELTHRCVEFLLPPCSQGLGGVMCMACGVCSNQAEHHHPQAMHDPSLSDETMGLLGEELPRAGQPLRLG